MNHADNRFLNFGIEGIDNTLYAQLVLGHEIGHNLVGLDRFKWLQSSDHGYSNVVPRDWSNHLSQDIAEEAVTNLALFVLGKEWRWNKLDYIRETNEDNLTRIDAWAQDFVANVQ